MTSWKEVLKDEIPPEMTKLIDTYEAQMALRQGGKMDEKVFAEARLRKGVYGQRYDNGQRHDGLRTQALDYPSGAIVKGPDTLWDAPGMQRIKIPYGGLSARQLEVLAELADEYADGILHITTRQDIQLHYVHIDDTPDLMRRLAAVGITTQEACGNSVRNITACSLAGVCHDEAFDVSPYADAMTQFLLAHDDVQDFGRKFKVAFSGCAGHACGLVKMHDLGLLAQSREVNGELQRGFTVYVGGGLGTVPHQAKPLAEFVKPEELLPLTQAIARVFARLGEKKNRNRARLKFLVAKLGIDEFRRLVEAELETLPHDPRHTAYLDDVNDFVYTPAKAGLLLNGAPLPDGFADWYRSNVYRQAQPGYSVVTLHTPLGDFTARQAFALADTARKYVGDNIRLTVEQNIVFRWVADADLPALCRELREIGLGDAHAGTIVDITTCPGTDTCKLGIASSRGLTAELRTRLIERINLLPDAVRELKIKVSGCFNSCGQHHVADIGFFGNSRRSGNHKLPHFQVVLGGQWQQNAGSYGLAVGAVPAKAVPEALAALTERYVAERAEDQPFQSWVKQLGRREIKAMLKPFMQLPTFEENPAFFSDWGDSRVYTIEDIGIGECAGEVVSLFSMEISKAESTHFEALLALDDGDFRRADERAYRAMLLAARALVRTKYLDVGDDSDRIVNEFRQRFYDTELVYDRFAKGKFARYLFKRHAEVPARLDEDYAHQIIDETQLFIENIHSAEQRINGVIVS
ncbi:MAG: nitrite/sulfite reductase [Chloroflexi bacterium]|nr:nitrite/sulfite reductase [Chloroflexota bacterium]